MLHQEKVEYVAIFEGSFKDKVIKRFYYEGTARGLSVQNTAKLQDILDYIDTLEALSPSPLFLRAHEQENI